MVKKAILPNACVCLVCISAVFGASCLEVKVMLCISAISGLILAVCMYLYVYPPLFHKCTDGTAHIQNIVPFLFMSSCVNTLDAYL